VRAAAAHIAETPRADPLKVFTLRCWARAMLWQAGEMDLHEAVDPLQSAAVASGLVAELGQDKAQQIITDAFHKVRENAP
jgi:hypothetical protein